AALRQSAVYVFVRRWAVAVHQEPSRGVRHQIVGGAVNQGAALTFASIAMKVVAPCEDVVRRSADGNTVFLQDLLGAIHEAAELIDGECLIWMLVEISLQRPLDPPWPSAHKCFHIANLAPWKHLVRICAPQKRLMRRFSDPARQAPARASKDGENKCAKICTLI